MKMLQCIVFYTPKIIVNYKETIIKYKFYCGPLKYYILLNIFS